MTQFKVLFWHLPCGAEENYEETYVMIASLWAEISTLDLPNMR
jgi:hypothetical protein